MQIALSDFFVAEDVNNCYNGFNRIFDAKFLLSISTSKTNRIFFNILEHCLSRLSMFLISENPYDWTAVM